MGEGASAGQNASVPKSAWRWLAGLAIVGLCLFAGYHAFASWAFSRALPAEIGVDYLIASGSRPNILFMLLIPFRHEPCGGAIFQLSEETALSLKEHGLGYLQAAQYGRGGNGRPIFGPWQETPVPSKPHSDGTPFDGLACMDSLVDVRSIGKWAREPGGYFTTGGEGYLFILPRQGLVVIAFFET